MDRLCFALDRSAQDSLQLQIRAHIVALITSGQLPARTPLPSTRKMAKILGVSRNTVVLAFQELIELGFLTPKTRSCYRIADDIAHVPAAPRRGQAGDGGDGGAGVLDGLIDNRPSRLQNIVKPLDWQRYRYPFIYGQPDPQLFPITAWRRCSAHAVSRAALASWTEDNVHQDDGELVDHIRTKLLPKRGIVCDREQILITMGAQNALYMIVQLLCQPGTKVAIEEPGYPDIRNMIAMVGAHVQPLVVDQDYVFAAQSLRGCRLAYVTPGHHLPTTVSMPLAQRRELLDAAADHGVIVIEDDYECETDFSPHANPALKSMDRDGRVIYVGSLSKSLFPGVRIGFVVASHDMIAEMRALRRLILRHVSAPIQRTVALFIGLGYHDMLVRSLRRAYISRWQKIITLAEALLPGYASNNTFGGTSIWLRGPAGLDTNVLAKELRDVSVLIEPGDVFFQQKPAPNNCFRLGYSAIDESLIEPGMRLIAAAIAKQPQQRLA